MVLDTESRESLFRRNLAENMEELSNNLSSLWDKRDRNFAQSLCDFFTNKGYLTSKQLAFAAKFWQETQAVQNNGDTGIEKLAVRKKAPSEQLPPRVVVDGRVLISFFDGAARTLQKPRIQYIVNPPIRGTEILIFYRTGDLSHSPKSVGVTNGLEHPNNRMLALCYRDGRTVFYPHSFDKPELQNLIKKIAENPLEEFAKNGKEQVHCCYCNKHLTHPSSIHYGYGPVCAGNWHLPWGEVPVPEMQLGIPFITNETGQGVKQT